MVTLGLCGIGWIHCQIDLIHPFTAARNWQWHAGRTRPPARKHWKTNGIASLTSGPEIQAHSSGFLGPADGAYPVAAGEACWRRGSSTRLWQASVLIIRVFASAGCPRRILVQLGDEPRRGGRGLSPGGKDPFVVPPLAVHSLVFVDVVAQGRAVKRYTREQATRAGPRKDFRHEHSVRLRRSVAANWATGRHSLGADREFASDEALHASLIHDEQNQVRRRDTRLESEAAALNADGSRGAPANAVSAAAERETAAV